MIEVVYEDGDWQILGHDYTFNLSYPFYAQHQACAPHTKGLMDWDHRTCYDCGEIVPDSIQTILYLLVAT